LKSRYKGKKFTKAPVVEAVFEIRFPLNLAVDSFKYKFYDAIKNTHPIIELVDFNPFEHPITQNLNYYSSDKSENLICGASKFAYITRAYKTYHEFKNNFNQYIKSFNECFNITEINRIGFRFINQIVCKKQENCVPLSNYLDFGFKLPDDIPLTMLKDFQTTLTLETKGGSIRSIIGTKNKGDQTILTLDNDLVQVGSFKMGNIIDLLDRAHEDIENIFLDFLSDKYLDTII
jgi:uncharacterized protein (TIGR04255 family)